MARLTPKNWRDFQHYKERSPPWIRLHKKLLDDFEFQRLHVASKALAPMLWLLASESVDGSIDGDPHKIAFRLRMDASDVVAALKPLIDNGFFVLDSDASNVLAECKQLAPKNAPETEALQRHIRDITETEKTPRKRDPSPTKPDDVSDQVWADWLKLRKAKRAPVTQTVIDGARTEAVKACMTFEAFLAVWCRRGTQGLEAAWLKPHERGAAQPGSFKDGDRRKAAQNIAAWTGGLAHDRSALAGPSEGLQTAFVIEGEAHEQRQIAG